MTTEDIDQIGFGVMAVIKVAFIAIIIFYLYLKAQYFVPNIKGNKGKAINLINMFLSLILLYFSAYFFYETFHVVDYYAIGGLGEAPSEPENWLYETNTFFYETNNIFVELDLVENRFVCFIIGLALVFIWFNLIITIARKEQMF